MTPSGQPDRKDSQSGQAGVAELCDRYGLQSDPFADVPGRFYTGGQRQIYLETLRHLCSFGDLLLVVEGEPGVGRSRLIEEFARLDKPTLTFHVLARQQVASTDALASALWQLLRKPLPGADPQQAISAFFDAAHWQRYAGKRWVVILDDADAAPQSVIDALAAGFQNAERNRSPVPLLIAGPGFAAALESRIGGARAFTHSLWVRPLDEAESAQFVESAISWAGGDPAGLLGPERRRKLYETSTGVFSRIKQTAPQVILGAVGPATSSSAGVRQPVTQRAAQSSKRNALWIGLALAVLLVSYGVVSWQYQFSGQSDNSGLASSVPATDSRVRPVGTSAAANAGTDEVERMRRAMAEAELLLRAQSVEEGSADEPTEIELPLFPVERSGESKTAVQPGSAPLLPQTLGMSIPKLIASALPPEPGEQVNDTRSEQETIDDGALGQAGPANSEGDDTLAAVEVPQAGLAVAPPGAGEPIPEAESEPEPEAEPDVEPEAEPEAEPEPVEVFQPQLPSAFRGRDWVAALPAGSVTVQLLGSYNEDTAVNLIRRYPDAGFVYIRSTYKDQPWFVVLLDVFEDAAPARSAISRLPAAIRRAGPWIRDTEGL